MKEKIKQVKLNLKYIMHFFRENLKELRQTEAEISKNQFFHYSKIAQKQIEMTLKDILERIDSVETSLNRISRLERMIETNDYRSKEMEEAQDEIAKIDEILGIKKKIYLSVIDDGSFKKTFDSIKFPPESRGVVKYIDKQFSKRINEILESDIVMVNLKYSHGSTPNGLSVIQTLREQKQELKIFAFSREISEMQKKVIQKMTIDFFSGEDIIKEIYKQMLSINESQLNRAPRNSDILGFID